MLPESRPPEQRTNVRKPQIIDIAGLREAFGIGQLGLLLALFFILNLAQAGFQSMFALFAQARPMFGVRETGYVLALCWSAGGAVAGRCDRSDRTALGRAQHHAHRIAVCRGWSDRFSLGTKLAVATGDACTAVGRTEPGDADAQQYADAGKPCRTRMDASWASRNRSPPWLVCLGRWSPG